MAEKLSKISGAKISYYYPRSFNELPAVTYYELSNSVASAADDLEYASRVAIQADVWAMDVETMVGLALEVCEIMEEDGFFRALAAELYESATGIYHKTMRFEKIVQ